MPSKISFRVAHVSGQDVNYRATELNHHGPLTKGWQSSRFCMYPQDIVLQLNGRARIKKIQILSHQYLITSKIEIFIGDVAEETQVDIKNVRYIRLGYISLSTNEKTNFRARELKSVQVDATGYFLKLNLHKNYINKHNLYNQVGIVAINIIGDEVLDDAKHVSTPILEEEPVVESPLDVFSKPDYISPLDDLAFDMYQDPEVAQLIRKLERKKQEAVLQERYEFAKRIKTGIEKLQKGGERLGKLEVEKRHAAENEDFDKALQKKLQIDDIRLQLYKQLDLTNLLEMNSPLMSFQPMETKLSDNPKEITDFIPKIDLSSPISLSTQRSVPRTPYEERPLPITNRQQNKFAHGDEIDDATIIPEQNLAKSGNGQDLEPMSEKDLKEASTAIDIFGQQLVSKAYSKNWTNREEALRSLTQQMIELSKSEDPRTVLKASILLIKRGIDDQVSAVFKSLQKLLQMIFIEFIPQKKIPRVETIYLLEKIMPNLLHRTGETAARTREEAKRFVLEISQYPVVKATNVVPNECVRPFKPTIAPRLAQSRAELVEQIYKEIGLPNSSNGAGVTVEDIMNFCNNACLPHNAEEVRHVAVRIIQNLYENIRGPVRNFLPLDDEKTRKNTLYRQIFDYFDKVDRKEQNQELKAVQENKKHEIEALQNQLKQMKSLAGKMNEEQQQKKPNTERKPEKNTRQLGNINIHINIVPKENQSSKKGSEKANKKNKLPTPIEEIPIEDDSNMDYSCIFCGEKNDAFDEKGLDIHYWKFCCMLKRCSHCKQVVEIAMFKKHLLTECTAKDSYRNCPRCQGAVLKSNYDAHIGDRSCKVIDATETLCPLCHMKIKPSDEGWKQHLMAACKNNPRLNLTQSKNQTASSGRTTLNSKFKEKSLIPKGTSRQSRANNI